MDDRERIVRLLAREAALKARVAELEARLAQAEHRATRDPLTGLLNRAGLAQEWAARRPVPGLMLALIDLDGFKQVNDQHGHAAGDDLLRAVAFWLRRTGGTAARLGGDEFVVLMFRPSDLPARVFTKLPGGPTVSAGLSVGVAPAVGDLGEVLSRADAAMYATKARGGCGVEEWDPYRHDRAVEPRPRVRLRDESAVVGSDVAWVA
ncbi:GGDEF domain-containing protein [Micromonospora sp. RP3T]|uniref:GGDEF domain-containing protein n=1 Tax=Micromonospora sp. RP3T TaxID=2135446 RepID=UPI003D75F8E9